MDNKIIEVDVNLEKPDQLVNFAKTLKQVIVDQKLYVNIQGKNYALVEAWQFAGGVLQVLPVVTALEDLSFDTDDLYKYRAVVELRRVGSGEVIGCGIAICNNKEKGKQYFDEYAIASMAQTRAIGKAYRNAFGWLMKLAGYEATPAEEMQTEVTNTNESKKDDIVKQHTAK